MLYSFILSEPVRLVRLSVRFRFGMWARSSLLLVCLISQSYSAFQIEIFNHFHHWFDILHAVFFIIKVKIFLGYQFHNFHDFDPRSFLISFLNSLSYPSFELCWLKRHRLVWVTSLLLYWVLFTVSSVFIIDCRIKYELNFIDCFWNRAVFR